MDIRNVMKRNPFVSFFTSSSVFSFVFQFVTILVFPLYSKVLSSYDFYMYAQLGVAASVLIIVTSLGFDSVYLRFEDDYNKKNLLIQLLFLRLVTNIVFIFPLIYMYDKFANLSMSYNDYFALIFFILFSGFQSLLLTFVRSNFVPEIILKVSFIQGFSNLAFFLILIYTIETKYLAFFYSSILSHLIVVLYVWNHFKLPIYNWYEENLLNQEKFLYGIFQLPHKFVSKLPETYLISYYLPLMSPALVEFYGLVAILLNPLIKIADIFGKSWVVFRIKKIRNKEFEGLNKYTTRYTLMGFIAVIVYSLFSKAYFEYSGYSFSLAIILSAYIPVFASFLYYLLSAGFEFYKAQYVLTIFSLLGFLAMVLSKGAISPDLILISRAIPFITLAIFVRLLVRYSLFELIRIDSLFIGLFMVFILIICMIVV